ncbi:fasciclin-like arabinogalactan protein 10 [Henckelia pumila]|uniref:fasciclin-like arabinogalactan protein 10 n=1 Tax=Henckelia pumila TaxID=405737 RepID=UPI003C6E203F
MAAFRRLLLAFSFVSVTMLAAATNITEILDAYPEYSEFNDLLSRTKVADEINSREPVTVCVLPNGGLSSYTGKYPLSVVKSILSLHVLLDYFDGPKLHKISEGSILSTTLYQTTGNSDGKLGFVNITVLRGGKVGFGSGIPGSPLDSSYTKSVKQVPYNVSVIEISQAIAPAGILTAAPAASDVNITGLLVKAGCKNFAALIVSTGVLKVYESAVDNGLTIFAPNDEAFKAADAPDLTTLTNAELVSILQYHALAAYSPIGTLKESKDKILTTLATNGAGKYALGVTTDGDSVSLDTGVDISRIASTVLDSTPLCIFTVDSILLPVELYGKPPSPAPAPAPETSPSPSPAADAPAPESAAAPAPVLSPPAPPNSSPDGAPSEGPTADSQNSTSDNAGGVLEAPALMKMVLTGAVSVFACVLLS